MTEGAGAKALGGVGAAALSMLHEVGGIGLMSARILWALVPPRMDGPETWLNLYRVGVKSFPIVVVTALFTGAIMVIQSGLYVEQYGAYGLLGWGAGFSVLREVGPIMIGLMFSGRVGANNTAELGTMQVTDQIDALRALAINPLHYLVVPRFVAMVVMLFLLVVVGDLTALVGGALTGEALLGVDMEVFAWSVVTFVTLEDFSSGLYKAAAFGVAIGVISCHFGMGVSGGAVGVGRAVNNSVVASAIAIFLLDYLLTYLLR
jgi:phospholipid/cholesterol/gamma-HCH transport system permease protein